MIEFFYDKDLTQIAKKIQFEAIFPGEKDKQRVYIKGASELKDFKVSVSGQGADQFKVLVQPTESNAVPIDIVWTAEEIAPKGAELIVEGVEIRKW